MIRGWLLIGAEHQVAYKMGPSFARGTFVQMPNANESWMNVGDWCVFEGHVYVLIQIDIGAIAQ